MLLLSTVSAVQVAVASAAFGLLYAAAISIYRLYFHPLAKFPGPKLAAITKWYEFYYDIVHGIGGQFAWEVRRMHEIYGETTQINPDELHIEDPDYYDTLYAGNPTKRDKYPPAAKMAGASMGTFGTVEHSIHRKRRVASSPLLSARSISEGTAVIQDEVQKLSDSFERSYKNGEIVDLRVRFLAFTTDTVTRFALGESKGLQTDGAAAEDWSKTIRAVARITPFVKQFPWIIDVAIRAPVPVVRFVLPQLSRLLDFHHDMHFHAKRYLSRHLQDEKNQSPDAPLFKAICESSLPPAEKEARRIAHEAVVVIAAGSETTSRVLSITMYHLLANPDILERLQKEIMTVMPDAAVIPSAKAIEELPYMVAVVREVLRISALITSRTPLMAHEQLDYQGWKIPARTPTSLTTHDILLDPEIFPEPNTFNPERWLVADSPSDRYFVPFGKGTRMCQGMRFAYVELYMVITTLLRRYEFQLYDTKRERDIDSVRDCFVGEPYPNSQGIRVEVVSKRP